MATAQGTNPPTRTWTPARPTREVYAPTQEMKDLLAAYNRVGERILALADDLGDKAPELVFVQAAGVRARHTWCYTTGREVAKAFGQPYCDYRFVPAPKTSRLHRWRMRLLLWLATTGS